MFGIGVELVSKKISILIIIVKFSIEFQVYMDVKNSLVDELIKESERLIEVNKIDEARAVLLNILNELDPESIDAANNYAVTEILKGDFESAEDLLRQILDKDKFNITANENLKYIKSLSVKSNNESKELKVSEKTTEIIVEENSNEYENEIYKEQFPIYSRELVRKENVLLEGSNSKLTIEQVRRISFEISNTCNLASAHKLCPVNQCKEKIYLSSKVVEKTIDELSQIKYNGAISFHIYNEPLIDPRLFYFIRYAKDKCPDSKIYILSNGQNLSQYLVEELEYAGVWMLVVSAYSMNDFNRLKNIKTKILFKVFKSVLDERLNMYDIEPLNLAKNCLPFIRDLSVNCYGDLIICCLDWKRKHSFGNLYNETISGILKKDEVQSIISTNTFAKLEALTKLSYYKKC